MIVNGLRIAFLWVMAFFILIGANGCEKKAKNESVLLTNGLWRAWLEVPGGQLPFQMDVSGTDSMEFVVRNGEERIPISEITQREDSLFVSMPFFDSELRLLIESPDTLSGIFYNHARKNHQKIPFHAVSNMPWRFAPPKNPPSTNLTGRWEVDFVYQDTIHSAALAEFQQTGSQLLGTFRTPTGDYRFLEGNVDGNEFQLSCFDGAHSFLFKGRFYAEEGGYVQGEFWSGTHWYETWWATRNENATLPSADSLTQLLPGYETIAFRFPNPAGEMISLTDERYHNKVVVVQILGTWCPNCLDESRFLADFVRQNQDLPLEVVGLAFEVVEDTATIHRNIRRLKDRLGITYEIAYAGQAGKTATESLPMLNKIKAYPTTLIIGKDGKVKRIHTGFNGPATGEKFETFQQDFMRWIQRLAGE